MKDIDKEKIKIELFLEKKRKPKATPKTPIPNAPTDYTRIGVNAGNGENYTDWY